MPEIEYFNVFAMASQQSGKYNIPEYTPQSRRKATTNKFANNDVEIWWDIKIKTLLKLEHDRPDIVLWKKKESKCYILDICVCLDVNID